MHLVICCSNRDISNEALCCCHLSRQSVNCVQRLFDNLSFWSRHHNRDVLHDATFAFDAFLKQASLVCLLCRSLIVSLNISYCRQFVTASVTLSECSNTWCFSVMLTRTEPTRTRIRATRTRTRPARTRTRTGPTRTRTRTRPTRTRT